MKQKCFNIFASHGNCAEFGAPERYCIAIIFFPQYFEEQYISLQKNVWLFGSLHWLLELQMSEHV